MDMVSLVFQPFMAEMVLPLSNHPSVPRTLVHQQINQQDLPSSRRQPNLLLDHIDLPPFINSHTHRIPSLPTEQRRLYLPPPPPLIPPPSLWAHRTAGERTCCRDIIIPSPPHVGLMWMEKDPHLNLQERGRMSWRTMKPRRIG
jgi:hypothetical protein